MNNDKITHTDGQLIKMLETMRQKGATSESMQTILQEGIFAAVVDPSLNLEKAKHGLGLTQYCIGPITEGYYFPGSNESSAVEMMKTSLERRYSDEFAEDFSEMTCLKSDANILYSYNLGTFSNSGDQIFEELGTSGVLSLSEMFWVVNNKEIQTKYDRYVCVCFNEKGIPKIVHVDTKDLKKVTSYNLKGIGIGCWHTAVIGRKREIK
ncbi:MAG: hypothetical protein WC878_00680 [Candidatus Paceibacterota bacterium]|jgi:hypothetical protein